MKKAYKTKDGLLVLDTELVRRASKAGAKKLSRKGRKAKRDYRKFCWTEDDFASGGVYFRHLTEEEQAKYQPS
ncbi:MAG: hypothetical protein WCC48_17175 [Anaeromyxobacteraceae bacterium]